MEGSDPIAELPGHIEHQGHFVCAVAVHVNADVAVQCTDQRIELQIAVGRIGLFAALVSLPLALVLERLDPRFPVAREVPHAARRKTALVAVGMLRVLAAGHLQAIRGAGKFHRLHRGRRHVLQHHGAPAEQIGGARQDLQRGHAARECAPE